METEIDGKDCWKERNETFYEATTQVVMFASLELDDFLTQVN